MPRHYQTPPSLRYLKARLRTLTRPAIWGTAIFLSVVGLLIREYWLNPNFFAHLLNNPVASSQNQNDSSLSPEDRAIAADIDNSPALLNEIQQSQLLATPGGFNDKNKASNNQGLFDQVIKKQQNSAAAAIATPTNSNPSNWNQTPVSPLANPNPSIVNPAPTPLMENPFVVQAQNLLQSGTLDRTINSLNTKPLTGFPSPAVASTIPTTKVQQLDNQPNQNQNPNPVTPLQTAINPYPTSSSLPINNREITPQTSGLTQPLSTNTLTSQPLPSTTSFNQLTGYNQPAVTNIPPQPVNDLTNNQPISSTNSTVTPVAPVAPTNIPSSSVSTPSQNPAVGGYYNFGNPQIQPSSY
ncbi:MAG: hypothetical protein VKL59_11665 [Nostocaceae cyanobacterium]|nr:hypothetical protein [Nostocaceae cyanobacterium]